MTTNLAVTLHNGSTMPLIGLGVWKIPNEITAETVYNAIKLGYRLLDCASDYGNEKEVGQGLAKAFAEKIVKREEMFITSKLWTTNHAREHVEPACRRTLADLQLDYLDLYLIHFPIALAYVDFNVRYPAGWEFDPAKKTGLVFVDVTYRETWEGMEQLVPKGLTKNIGVSNINCQAIMELLKYAKIKPAVNQIEHHPYLQQPQLINYCASKGIAITAFSPLGGASYIQLGNKDAIHTTSLMELDQIKQIAAHHNVTPAQVLFRWAVQRNIAIVPKSSNVDRLKENISLNFQLSPEEMSTIKSLERHLRFNDPSDFVNYPIFG